MNTKQQERRDEILSLRTKLEESEMRLFGLWKNGGHDVELTAKSCEIGQELLECERMYRMLYGEVP